MTTSIDSVDDRLHTAAHVPDRTATKIADRTDQAIRRTQRVANDALDQLSGAVQNARDKTVPALERLGADAETMARRGIEAARSGSQRVRDKAYKASEQTTGYIRDEPFKSVLIAAAAGALLMGVIALFSRSSTRV